MVQKAKKAKWNGVKVEVEVEVRVRVRVKGVV